MPIRKIVPRPVSPTPSLAPTTPASPARRFRIRRVEPAVSPASPQEANRNPDGSYIVGKNRPPQSTKFRPGQSGNPKGRPKGAKGLNTLTVEVLGAKVPVKMAGGEKKMSAAEFSLHKLREMASKGDLRAILAILERWQRAVPDQAVEAPSTAQSDQPLSDTDRAVLDLFADEIRNSQLPPINDVDASQS